MSGGVKFGLTMGIQYEPGIDMAAMLHNHIRQVQQARDDGWDSLLVGEHFLTDPQLQVLQPIPLAARLAAESGDMRLVLGILLLALHHPVAVAEEIATLDVISGGRVVVGVGLGYRDVEFNAFGVPRRHGVRRLESNLAIIKQLWSGEAVTVDLPWCQIDSARLSTLPVQRPRPPIVMAADSDGAVNRAARLADAWLINPHSRLATVGRQWEMFCATRAEAGLPPVTEVPVLKEMVCAPTHAKADELAQRYLGAKYQGLADWGQDTVMPSDDPTFRLPFEQLKHDRFIVGSPDQCVRSLLAWHDKLGANHFILRLSWSGMPVEEAMRSQSLITKEVIPAVRAHAVK